MTPDAVQAISDWLINEALHGTRIEDLGFGYVQRLRAAGVPIDRAHLGFSSLHPRFEARTLQWAPETGLIETRIPYGSDAASDEWRNSPFRALAEEETDRMAFRLDGDAPLPYPILEDLRAEGFTEYFARGQRFSDRHGVRARNDGMVTSIATRAPGGFPPDTMEAMGRLHPRFALAVKMANRQETAQNVLNAFLGEDPGGRVLDGRIHLGDADMIPSVIYFLDMRGSTPLAEALGPERFLGVLNRFFQAAAQPVLDHGGDVLRYIGDAALAVFPIEGAGGDHGRRAYSPDDACRRALSAVADGLSAIETLNTDLAREDLPAVGFTAGLHVGDVLFANIGVPDRVEFTVIGPAANAAARVQAKAKEAGERVLVTEAFTTHVSDCGDGRAWRRVGRFHLRGVTEALTLFGAPEDPS
jgi:adenylate cyclase